MDMVECRVVKINWIRIQLKKKHDSIRVQIQPDNRTINRIRNRNCVPQYFYKASSSSLIFAPDPNLPKNRNWICNSTYRVFKEFGSGSNVQLITGSGSATLVEFSIVIMLLAAIYLTESV